MPGDPVPRRRASDWAPPSAHDSTAAAARERQAALERARMAFLEHEARAHGLVLVAQQSLDGLLGDLEDWARVARAGGLDGLAVELRRTAEALQIR